MSRFILLFALGLLILLAFRLIRLLTKFRTKSRPNVDDLKKHAEELKNKYKNIEEADFRDITPEDEDHEPTPKS